MYRTDAYSRLRHEKSEESYPYLAKRPPMCSTIGKSGRKRKKEVEEEECGVLREKERRGHGRKPYTRTIAHK
jgi:hypothetical protein